MPYPQSRHFSRLISSSLGALDAGMGLTSSSDRLVARPALGVHSMHTSTSARANMGIPTLGETGVKFNSSRWTQGGADAGMSVFDMKGAMDTLQKGPDEQSIKRAHPAQLAHAARIARAQQTGITFNGYKVFPDLTPGRAFMWGSILAVYVVGMGAYSFARSVGVTSVDDVKEKMQLAFAPYRESFQAQATTAKESMELKERPALLQHLQVAGRSISRQLSKPEDVEDIARAAA